MQVSRSSLNKVDFWFYLEGEFPFPASNTLFNYFWLEYLYSLISEVANQAGNEQAVASNQASYGYQAASSPEYYQSQNQAPYVDQQQSNSQGSYPSYNTQAYNDNTANDVNKAGYQGYNDVTPYQQRYGESQAQNTAGQANYYSNEQQYQNGADPGSYYTG